MNGLPEWMEYARAGFALLFVIGLIILSGALLRRTGFAKRVSAGKDARIKLVETLYLDPRRRLVMVEIDGRQHVLLLSAGGDLLVTSCEGSGSNEV